jgi:uncharacterized protein YjbJ (UPF0337 family)
MVSNQYAKGGESPKLKDWTLKVLPALQTPFGNGAAIGQERVTKQAERLMGKLKEITRNVVGGAKEVVAEVIGDAGLSEEGKAQRREPDPARSDPESSSRPFGYLDRLT